MNRYCSWEAFVILVVRSTGPPFRAFSTALLTIALRVVPPRARNLALLGSFSKSPPGLENPYVRIGRNCHVPAIIFKFQWMLNVWFYEPPFGIEQRGYFIQPINRCFAVPSIASA